MGRLIVNADDFGLTAGVNRAVAELSRAGVLTSTTLMARAKATADAVRLARETPALRVGCHVVLVDGEPVLPPDQIPTLVDRRTGLFNATLGGFLQRLFRGNIRSSEIEAEAAAQIAILRAEGVALTHVDTHKHVHMFPAVLRPVLRAARAAGICAVRNPFEPAWSLRVAVGAPWLRRVEVSLLRYLEPHFRRIVEDSGFITTDGAIGVLSTGTLDFEGLSALLSNLPAGSWELVTHPGYSDSDLAQAGTRLVASREIERNGLLAVKDFPTLELISFADLTKEKVQ